MIFQGQSLLNELGLLLHLTLLHLNLKIWPELTRPCYTFI